MVIVDCRYPFAGCPPHVDSPQMDVICGWFSDDGELLGLVEISGWLMVAVDGRL